MFILTVNGKMLISTVYVSSTALWSYRIFLAPLPVAETLLEQGALAGDQGTDLVPTWRNMSARLGAVHPGCDMVKVKIQHFFFETYFSVSDVVSLCCATISPTWDPCLFRHAPPFIVENFIDKELAG